MDSESIFSIRLNNSLDASSNIDCYKVKYLIEKASKTVIYQPISYQGNLFVSMFP